MARYDTVIAPGFNRVLVCERQVDGGYDYVLLHIFSDAEGTVIKECANGDVWVVFPDWPFKDFVFKREELVYVTPPESDVIF